METELEVKILEINPQALVQKLLDIGAEKVSETVLQRRYVYDVIPPRDSAWIRLRDDGKKITLTIKEILNDEIDGTKEIEVTVDNLQKANKLLEFLGFKSRAYQENKRTSFKLGSVEIEIDEWPQIPPYMEIEGPSKEEIEEVVSQLGYSMSDTTSENTEKIYARYGLDIHSFPELKFS